MFHLNMFSNALFTSRCQASFKHVSCPGCVIYAVLVLYSQNLAHFNRKMEFKITITFPLILWFKCQFLNPSEEKGFPAFSEQTAFALSSVQKELFAIKFCNCACSRRSSSFVAMFSQIFCFQPIPIIVVLLLHHVSA